MLTVALSIAIQAAALAPSGSDYTAAYQRSLNSGRPLVVLVGAKWCPACEVMKNEVLPKVAQKGGMRNVEFAYVDFDREPELAKQLLKGSAIPQMVRFQQTERGWKTCRLTGAKTRDEVARFMVRCPDRPVRPGGVAAQWSSWSKPSLAADRP